MWTEVGLKMEKMFFMLVKSAVVFQEDMAVITLITLMSERFVQTKIVMIMNLLRYQGAEDMRLMCLHLLVSKCMSNLYTRK